MQIKSQVLRNLFLKKKKMRFPLTQHGRRVTRRRRRVDFTGPKNVSRIFSGSDNRRVSYYVDISLKKSQTFNIFWAVNSPPIDSIIHSFAYSKK